MLNDIMLNPATWIAWAALFSALLTYGFIHDARQRRRHYLASPRRQAATARATSAPR